MKSQLLVAPLLTKQIYVDSLVETLEQHNAFNPRSEYVRTNTKTTV